MARSKLEIAKDVLMALGNLVFASTDIMHTLEENLGQDYGMYQVIALMKLAQQDLTLTAFQLEAAPE